MRIEPVIAISGSDTVGPTRIRLHTASSAKLPVVITTHVEDADWYYVYEDIASLQSVLVDQSSTTTIEDALIAGAVRRRWSAVASIDITGTEPGVPVVDDGRLIGITAADIEEQDEPTELNVPVGNDQIPRAKLKNAFRKRLPTQTDNQRE